MPTMGVMRLDDARQFSLSLPETTEEPHFEKSSFRVKGKIFATIPEGGTHMNLVVDPDELVALLEQARDVFSQIVWGKQVKTDWVCVRLAGADRDQVCEL